MYVSLIYGRDEQRADYFRKVMDAGVPGTENYRKAREIYAFLVERIRKEEKIANK